MANLIYESIPICNFFKAVIQNLAQTKKKVMTYSIYYWHYFTPISTLDHAQVNFINFTLDKEENIKPQDKIY